MEWLEQIKVIENFKACLDDVQFLVTHVVNVCMQVAYEWLLELEWDGMDGWWFGLVVCSLLLCTYWARTRKVWENNGTEVNICTGI